jgi:uncharacterized membrane protein YuzA (DUF378 family)
MKRKMEMQRMLNKVAHTVAAIGAINVGLSVFFHYDLVAHLAVILNMHQVAMLLYGLIGLSGLYSLISCFIPCEC